MLYELWLWHGRKYVHPVGVIAYWHGVHISGFRHTGETDGWEKVYFPLLVELPAFSKFEFDER
jgi:hypothetical protein